MLEGEPEIRLNLREIIPSLFSWQKMLPIENRLTKTENQQIQKVLYLTF